MATSRLNRRAFLISTAVTGAAGSVVGAQTASRDGELGAPPQTLRGAVPWQPGAADSPTEASGTGYTFFNPSEQAFVEAAVARLIPSDPVGPGALEAGVPFFLDRQLAGPYGGGAHFYLGGPWQKGSPEQGYQMRFTPAQLYRAAIAAIDRAVASSYNGASFAKRGAADQDQVLKSLEEGALSLDGGVDAKGFFAAFLQNVKEGYFADPIYGGNRDMAAWKMIGFPGAHYNYKEWVARHGEPIPFAPVGLRGRPGWRTG
jgi:gluconate 2-dehydrogenase gamma chain